MAASSSDSTSINSRARPPLAPSSARPRFMSLADLPKKPTLEEELEQISQDALEGLARARIRLKNSEEKLSSLSEFRKSIENFPKRKADYEASLASVAETCADKARTYVKSAEIRRRLMEKEKRAAELQLEKKFLDMDEIQQWEQTERFYMENLANEVLPEEVYLRLRETQSQAESWILVLSHLKDEAGKSRLTRLIGSLRSLIRKTSQILHSRVEKLLENRLPSREKLIAGLAITILLGTASVFFKYYPR